ncbi:ABC transporter substrate-binding protein [Pseudomonas sp.]|uniref:ABC transporter substrate-binding protein n=1 Tax=Pseudomonas sp. TaxID=306 RepID=UPI0028A668BB|nr:ABC transporter substrate-binding protein [Pseudomonas sp.]
MARALRLLLLCLFPWVSTCVGASEVLLIGADSQPSYRSFTAGLQARRAGDTVAFRSVRQMPRPGALSSDVRLILLDRAALDWRLGEAAGPTALVLRVNRVQAQQRWPHARPAFLSLLWSDPSPVRQLRLIHYLLPKARRVGVLYSARSRFLLDELHPVARQLGLQIVPQAWTGPRDSRALREVLASSDVLLGLDDPELYNAITAKNLLLSSYARQIALVGPTAGFVRAGALASTYSDQTDWLAVLDQLLDQPPAHWPRSLYPNQFGVSGNQQVARTLGLQSIDSTTAALVIEGTPNP